MKKLIFFLAIVAFALVACQPNSDDVVPDQEVVTIDMSDFSSGTYYIVLKYTNYIITKKLSLIK